jgi:tetratricopeptide (TPR) repeat protein
MIPIEDLLSADHTSPYYNERNRVSVFYAESWAMVHYLLLDPEARNQQLLAHFIRAWEASGDQVEAARETFGDLKKFSQTMEAYARKQQFMVGTLKTAVRGDPKSLMSREMPPAELAAYRALFYIHTKRPAEAEAAVQEALQQNPQLSVAYEAQGLEAYAQNQFAAAGRSFARAVALGEASFSAYYFDAMSELRAGVETEADQEHVIASFEKAIAMNALFAPAFANLASLYSMRPATSAKAIQLAGKAVELDPGNLRYAINFAHVLLNAGKVDEAKELAVRIRRAAWIPADKADADQLFRNVTDYEEQSRQAAQRARLAEEAQAANNTRAVGGTAPATAAAAPRPAGRAPAAAPPKDRRSQYMVEGLIAEAECNSNSSGRVTLSVNHSTMRFVYSSLAGLSLVEGLTEDTGHAPACANWKGRRARLFFFQTKDKPYAGELQTIQFF